MFGQQRNRVFDRSHHFRLRFADAYAADGVAVKIHRNESFGAFLAQGRIARALDNAEDLLAISARLFAAFFGPANRSINGSAEVFGRAVMRRAIVEDHGDVRAEQALNFHRFLRADKEERAVKMGAEFDALRFDFANLCQAEDLETAAVGENWPGPVDELMQTARSLNDVQAGPDEEMIGIAENDLRAHLAQFAWIKGLDAALRADRHEHGRIDDAAAGHEAAEPRQGRGVFFEELEQAMDDG